MRFLRLLLLCLSVLVNTLCLAHYEKTARPIYAVNCGGEEYTSTDRVRYRGDVGFSGGIKSDEGKRFLPFPRAADSFVYSTERYVLERDLTYTLPVPSTGTFVLVLKFSEVYFDAPLKKVFAVSVAGVEVVPRLDIFERVGKGVPHDVLVSVEVQPGGEVLVNGGRGQLDQWRGDEVGGVMSFTLHYIDHDNPKINAFILYEGTMQSVPTLRPLKQNMSLEDEVVRRHSPSEIDSTEISAEANLDSESFDPADYAEDFITPFRSSPPLSFRPLSLSLLYNEYISISNLRRLISDTRSLKYVGWSLVPFICLMISSAALWAWSDKRATSGRMANVMLLGVLLVCLYLSCVSFQSNLEER